MNGNPKNSFRTVLLGLTVAATLLCGCNLPGRIQNSAGTQAYQSGNFNLAVSEFQKAIQSNPRDANAYYNLAACYQTLAKQNGMSQWTAQAEQLYRQAIALNGQHIDAHRGLAAMLVESGKEQFAFDLLNEWRTRNPYSEDPLVELARLYQEYGDNRRAVDLLSDALKINSQSTRALAAMGHVREIQGQPQLALENYARALQLDSQLGEVANRVATLQNQMGMVPNQADPGPSDIRYGAVDPYIRR